MNGVCIDQGSSTPGPWPGAGPWASWNQAVDMDLHPPTCTEWGMSHLSFSGAPLRSLSLPRLGVCTVGLALISPFSFSLFLLYFLLATW